MNQPGAPVARSHDNRIYHIQNDHDESSPVRISQRPSREHRERIQILRAQKIDFPVTLRFLIHAETVSHLRRHLLCLSEGEVVTEGFNVRYSLAGDPLHKIPEWTLTLNGHFNSCLSVLEKWYFNYFKPDHFWNEYYGGPAFKCIKTRHLVHERVVGMLIGVRGLQVDSFSFQHDCDIQVLGVTLPKSTERVASIVGRVSDTVKVIRDMYLTIISRPGELHRNTTFYHPSNYIFEVAKRGGGVALSPAEERRFSIASRPMYARCQFPRRDSPRKRCPKAFASSILSGSPSQKSSVVLKRLQNMDELSGHSKSHNSVRKMMDKTQDTGKYGSTKPAKPSRNDAAPPQSKSGCDWSSLFKEASALLEKEKESQTSQKPRRCENKCAAEAPTTQSENPENPWVFGESIYVFRPRNWNNPDLEIKLSSAVLNENRERLQLFGLKNPKSITFNCNVVFQGEPNVSSESGIQRMSFPSVKDWFFSDEECDLMDKIERKVLQLLRISKLTPALFWEEIDYLIRMHNQVSYDPPPSSCYEASICEHHPFSEALCRDPNSPKLNYPEQKRLCSHSQLNIHQSSNPIKDLHYHNGFALHEKFEVPFQNHEYRPGEFAPCPQLMFPVPKVDHSMTVIELVVDNFTAGTIIGTGGEAINRIRRSCNCVIFIQPQDGQGNDRQIILSGGKQNVADALTLIAMELQAKCDHDARTNAELVGNRRIEVYQIGVPGGGRRELKLRFPN